MERLKGGPAAYECLDVADNEYSDGKTADKAIADLKKLSTSNKPFFLAVGILKPHLPFNAPKRYWDLYDESKISLPETFNFDRTGFLTRLSIIIMRYAIIVTFLPRVTFLPKKRSS